MKEERLIKRLCRLHNKQLKQQRKMQDKIKIRGENLKN